MLGFIGIKYEIILYHIQYSIVLSCPTISGVIGCSQLKWWLIGIGLVTKLDCGRICCTCTPTWVASVLDPTGCKEVISYSFINLFNLSSTKGQFLNSCPTCWQYAYVNAISIVG
jgi:hypothetical protein